VASIDLTADDGDDEGSLSPVYNAALRLEAEGLTPRQIAERLEVAVESVPLLLDLARRKLNRRITAKHTNG
jgi:DNA-directed RNA polymerase specialized sigma24 family protein